MERTEFLKACFIIQSEWGGCVVGDMAGMNLVDYGVPFTGIMPLLEKAEDHHRGHIQ